MNDTPTRSAPELRTRREGAVQVLSYHNPAARNALSLELYAALPPALAAAERDPEVGAIVLTGSDGVFCAGGDLARLAKQREVPLSTRRAGLERLGNMVRALRGCRKPIVAAVEGAAVGAGMTLALACDMLVSARSAYYSVTYVKVGLTPDGGITSYLSNFLSRQILTEWCMTGERITAERLQAVGAVNRLVETGRAEAEAIALAQQIAAGPQRALGRIKALCSAAHARPFEAQLDAEADAMAQSQGDDEAAEGIGAFFGKRTADFAKLRRTD